VVHWSVYKVEQKDVIYEATTVGYSHAEKNYEALLVAALKNALDGFMSDPKFQSVSLKSNTGDSFAQQEAIDIKKLNPIKYNGYSDLVTNSTRSVVTIKTNFGHGSGFLISDDGYILTNNHVVSSAEAIQAVFDNGFTLDAKVVRKNEERDVAILKISGSGFKPLNLMTTASNAQTGTEVIAIGTPEDVDLGQTVTKGIVSGYRKLEEKNYIQTDVAINPGNSGGPLINTTTGEVIGIISNKLMGRKDDAVEGLGFAIPISEVIKDLNLSLK